jgi:N4-gp56 family major capsid protein
MADMGLTEVSAAVMTEISEFVQAELKQRAKLLPTVQNFPAAPGMGQVDITRAGGFTANDKAENTDLTAQTITFAADSLALDKHKAVYVVLEDIANIQARPDVTEQILTRMASEMALQIDRDIVTELESVSTAAPDHLIAYADATSYKKADVLEARALLHEQNVPFNECYIGVSPRSEVSLLAVDDFVHVDKYGSSEAVMNGEIGRLYGARVIMSNVFDDAKTVTWHPTHCAVAIQQQLNFERDRSLAKIATEFLANQLYGVKVLDSGLRGVVQGTAA